MSKNISQDTIKQTFVDDVRGVINAARQTAVRSVDFCRVQMYWYIGRRIFEEEQQGKECAESGTYLIKNLASRLEPEYGSGFTTRQLERSRQFCRLFPIASTLRSQLNWSQYKLQLMEEVNNAKKMAEKEKEGEI